MTKKSTREHLPVPKPLTVSRSSVLVGGSDETFRRVVHNLLALSSRLQEVNAGYASIVGVTPVQYTVLSAIAQKQENAPVTVKDVAEHLHLSGSFVTIETGKLVRSDFVDKKVDPADRRRVNLRTTPKADARLRLLNGFQCPVNNIVFESLSTQEFLGLGSVVEKLLADADRGVSLLSELIPLAGAVDAGLRSQKT